MNRRIFRVLGGAGLLMFFLSACSVQKRSDEWFKKGSWYNGMALVPHHTLDRSEFSAQYSKNKSWWDTAFNYLRDTDFSKVAPGTYKLAGGDVYAKVTVGPMKDFKDTRWESHRKMIDLQYNYSGAERMSVAPVQGAIVTMPYNEQKDVANYDTHGKIYDADSRTFFLFFPNQAHRPNIKTNNDQQVKKVTIKIRYTE